MAPSTNGLTKGIAITVFIVNITILFSILIVLWTIPDDKIAPISDYLTTKFELKLKKLDTENTTTIPMPNGKFEWNLKPMAHLSGSILESTEGFRKGMVPIRKWTERNDCFLQNGMDYRNGRLVVPIKGYYHLYAFIDMIDEYYRDRSFRTDNISIEMGIYKTNILNRKEQELFCTCRPYEMSQNHRFTVYETYTGADVLLQAGDEIYVKVSNISYIKNPSRNVFGLHMI